MGLGCLPLITALGSGVPRGAPIRVITCPPFSMNDLGASLTPAVSIWKPGTVSFAPS